MELQCSSQFVLSRTVQFHIVLGLFLSVVIHRCEGGGLSRNFGNRSVSTIIVFGDSIMDPGNNNHLRGSLKCNFPPYGRDFMEGRPTGRFSNGKIPSDFIAEMFGVKDTLPAYLDPSLKTEDLLTGVSFASGGSGYDPLTAKRACVLSLKEQMALFKEYKARLTVAKGKRKTAALLASSIFIVCVGSNDIANTYSSTPLRNTKYGAESYTDLMAAFASSFIQEMYDQGARTIGILSTPPIGCVPFQRTIGGGLHRRCSDDQNRAARLFNSKLLSTLNSLRTKLLNTRLVYLDIYNPVMKIIQNSHQYGFDEATKGCCGSGTIEGSFLCNKYTHGTCTDASKYIFWDSYHPTEKTYNIIVTDILNKYGDQFF